jgi:hypothetical protein
MKYVMALSVVALVACGGQNNRPPPKEPVSSTTTTTSALTVSVPEAVPAEDSSPIIAAKEGDRNLGTKIRAHLERDQALKNVGWRRVTMQIDDGHVTLRGNLPTVADSTEMERSIREVKGVTAVTNDIQENDRQEP